MSSQSDYRARPYLDGGKEGERGTSLHWNKGSRDQCGDRELFVNELAINWFLKTLQWLLFFKSTHNPNYPEQLEKVRQFRKYLRQEHAEEGFHGSNCLEVVPLMWTRETGKSYICLIYLSLQHPSVGLIDTVWNPAIPSHFLKIYFMSYTYECFDCVFVRAPHSCLMAHGGQKRARDSQKLE